MDRALAWDESERRPSFHEIVDLLAEHTDDRAPERPDIVGVSSSRRSGASEVTDPLDIAYAVGRRLVEAAVHRDGGVCWPSAVPGGALCSADLYHGAAGIALYLATLGRHCEDVVFIDTARAAARWLSGPVWSCGRGEPGLYLGESGVGLFYLRLADLLAEPAYVRLAELRAQRICDVEAEPADLLTGRAGHLLFLVELAKATSKDRHLEAAALLADGLARDWCLAVPSEADNNHHGGSNPDLDGWSRDTVLGLAHGAAGVGLSLLGFADATGDARARAAALECGRRLLKCGEEHPNGGWIWPEALDRRRYVVQAQCHGAGGIGRFLLRLTTDGGMEYAAAAGEAAITARRESPYRPSASLCHGVAGDGLFFLECASVLGDARYSDWARESTEVLERHRSPHRSGHYRGLGPAIERPELLVGDAGVGLFHLSLAAGLADPILGPPR